MNESRWGKTGEAGWTGTDKQVQKYIGAEDTGTQERKTKTQGAIGKNVTQC